jgi:hypothetical protein
LAVAGKTTAPLCRTPPSPRYLGAWIRTVERLVQAGQVPVAVVTIIDSRASPPDDVSKQAIRRTISRHAAHICGLAYVVEGQGFGAAAVRGALSLISLAAKYPFPQKVFATVATGGAWIIERMADRVGIENAAEMVTVADALSRAVKQAVLAS